MGALASTGHLKIAAALLLCGPFIPMLFQGEEWNAGSPFLYFTNYQDEALGRAVSQGRRREFAAFGWDPESIPDPQDPETFHDSKLQWDELERAPHGEMLAWYRNLIALRRKLPALRSGPVRVRYEEGRWLAVDRGAVTIAVNAGTSPVGIPVTDGMQMALFSEEGVRCEDGYALMPTWKRLRSSPLRRWPDRSGSRMTRPGAHSFGSQRAVTRARYDIRQRG